MSLRGPLTIAALLAMALVLGNCFPSGLSDAERVWCDERPTTVIAAADALNI